LFYSDFVFSNSPSDNHCCSGQNCENGTFTLDVATSFHGCFIFEICQSKAGGILDLTIERPVFDVETKISQPVTEQKQIRLTLSEYQNLYSHYEKSLQYNPLDKTMGLDGSCWCLESQLGFSYTKGCFWTPSHNPEKRGLDGLYQLGVHLWQISGLTEDHFLKLY